jgi:hypothetical protein
LYANEIKIGMVADRFQVRDVEAGRIALESINWVFVFISNEG